MTSRIVAIVNQKGGVGKTTTSINLSAALASLGQRVLLIDLDPQGNATTGLGIARGERDQTLYDVIVDETTIDGTIQPTNVPRLDIVASDMDLSGAEIILGTTEGRTLRLKNALAPIVDDYDYILIDCPPALGLLTVNALAAAHSVIVPLQCEFFALEGLSQLLRTVETAKSGLNPDLVIDGVMLTMYDKRNRLSDQVARDVKQHLGRAVFDVIIPRNVRIAEAPSFGQPVIQYDAASTGADAYRALAKEVLKRHGREKQWRKRKA